MKLSAMQLAANGRKPVQRELGSSVLGCCVIRLLETAAGVPTEFDGKYVKRYDPGYVHPEGYDGGILEVTSDKREAMRFPGVAAAFAKWKQSYGLRSDGLPNRPLTAWTIEVEPAPQEIA